MSGNTVFQSPPFAAKMVDENGLITVAWQDWFTQSRRFMNAAGGKPIVPNGSYTGTLSGLTAVIHPQVSYNVTGNIVTQWVRQPYTGNSNSTTMQLSGAPSQLGPPSGNDGVLCYGLTDSGDSSCLGVANISSAGLILLGLAFVNPAHPISGGPAGENVVDAALGNWTPSGVKGLNANWMIIYPLV